ncbi:MAG TPA: glycosyltransferase N-terminal domain-containing protein [Gemmatimonadales bacterium]|nr:glycosyltransferase N-terminal domain-containing protein [Gemmatimonadales bacterium]
MPSTSWVYRAALRLGTALVPFLGTLSPKLRRSALARRDAGERLLEWSRSSREVTRPLVWFHAASVGEGLQADIVLRHLRRLRPDCQIAYTHFSPSAEALAARLAVDVADYLPYDLPHSVDRLLSALQPDLLVFAKLDVWPELATRASTTGTEVAIVAATVRPGSGRLRWPARAFLLPGYRVIAAAAAISGDDAARLTQLGVAPDRVHVLGDPRFDSVIEKVRGIGQSDPLLRFGRGAPTLVAGSTWPPDEAVLLRAFAALRHRREARLIIVPHEPTDDHLRAIDRNARAAGLPVPVRLSRAEGPEPLLLVDQVGVLAGLYGAGSMAYVGGGFGSAGLHSVLEPAAWGIPVAFGPRWANSRDAMLLLERGGGTALPRGGVGQAAAALKKLWEDWIRDEAGRRAQGAQARQVVEGGLGAAAKSAEMLADLISSRPLRTSPSGAQLGRR